MHDCASSDIELGDQIDFARGHLYLGRLRLRTLEIELDRAEAARADGAVAEARKVSADVLRRIQRLLDALSEDDIESWNNGVPSAFSLYQT